MKRLDVSGAAGCIGKAAAEGPDLPIPFNADAARELTPTNDQAAQTPHMGPRGVDEVLPAARTRSRRPRYCEG